MKFQVPFDGPVTTISGSSFAAAIVTGRIGAFLPNSVYVPNIDKRVLTCSNQMEAGARLITKSVVTASRENKERSHYNTQIEIYPLS